MSTKMNTFIRFFLCAVLFLAGNACILSTAATPAATPQAGAPAETADPGEPEASAPTAEPTPTLTPEPTATQTPTATVAPVTMTAGQNLSCVTGPHWILYEWVASIPEGETVLLLARSAPGGEEYYYVRKADGTECWAFGGSSIKSGDVAGLPIRETPPLPVITFAVQNNTYLRVEEVYIRGKDESSWGADRLAGTLNHGETFTVSLTAGFYDVLIKDHHAGAVFEKYDAPIGPEAGSRTAVIDGRYTQHFHSVSTATICRVHVESNDDVYQVNLTIPGDGRISPGETIDLDSLAGSYETFFYRCGEDVSSWYAISSVYFGPSSYTITIH